MAYIVTEAFARYIITTNAPTIEVFSMQDTLSTPGGANAVGITVNGTPQGDGFDLGSTLGVVESKVWVLPAGTNTIELIAGQNYLRPNSTIGSTPNLMYRIPFGYTQSVVAPTAPAKRILLVTDSIFSGPFVNAGPNQAGVFQAVSMLIRKNALASGGGAFAGAHVTMLGADGLTLQHIAFDAGTITATVALWVSEMDGTVANEIVITLGTNDYGAVQDSAATFQTQLGNLLDAVHTALPAVTVVLVTPITRGTETANTAGSTLPDFRTAEATVQSTRGAYCSIQAGPGIVSAFSDYNIDHLHLNTNGMSVLEAGLRTALGYT